MQVVHCGLLSDIHCVHRGNCNMGHIRVTCKLSERKLAFSDSRGLAVPFQRKVFPGGVQRNFNFRASGLMDYPKTRVATALLQCYSSAAHFTHMLRYVCIITVRRCSRLELSKGLAHYIVLFLR